MVYQNYKNMQTQYEYLTDSQWEIIKEYLPVQRKRKHDLREIVNGILWILRIGGQWRNLPEKYPPWKSVYYYFSKWKKGETPSLLSIDSQSIKSGPFTSEDKGIDGNKKINGRKRHIITDTLGLIWGVVVHAANLTDGGTAHRVVEPLQGYLSRMEKILADAAYKTTFMDWVTENLLGVELEISSKPPSTKGFVPVKWRWVTEQTFGRFNFFRRLDKDHEKTANSSEAWVLWQNCQTIIFRLG